MTLKNIMLTAAAVACTAAFAAEEAKKAETSTETKAPVESQAKTAEPAKPEVKMTEADIDKLLAFIPEKVATYKDGTITRAEIVSFIRPNLLNAAKEGAVLTQEQVTQFTVAYADQMLTQKLLAAEATAKGFTPDKEAAAKQVAEIKKQNGEEEFKKLLATLNLTEADITNKIAESIMIKMMIESLIKVDDAEVKKFYDEHPEYFTQMSASHILAIFPSIKEGKMPNEEEDKATLAKIQEVQKELAAGKDFAELAKKYSDCPSKEDGGKLGSFAPNQVYPEFAEACKKLKKDEISGPVKSQAGYHIIKGGETKLIPFDEVKENIAENLKQEQGQKTASELIQKLRKEKEAKVLIVMPAPAAPAAPPAAPAAK